MFKKVLAALSAATAIAALALSGPAPAANLPILSGSQYSEPSQQLATANAVIQSVNTGVSGILSNALTQFSSATGTAEQTMFTYSLPVGQIPIGSSVRVTCWGTTGATANNKTRKLYFGASVLTTATEAANAQNWYLELLVTVTGAATQSVVGRGLAGTGGVTPISYVNQGTDSMAAAVVIKCTGTDGTSAAGDILANGMLVEQVK